MTTCLLFVTDVLDACDDTRYGWRKPRTGRLLASRADVSHMSPIFGKPTSTKTGMRAGSGDSETAAAADNGIREADSLLLLNPSGREGKESDKRRSSAVPLTLIAPGVKACPPHTPRLRLSPDLCDGRLHLGRCAYGRRDADALNETKW